MSDNVIHQDLIILTNLSDYANANPTYDYPFFWIWKSD